MSKTLGDAFVRVRPDTDGFANEAQSGMSGGLKKLAIGIGSALASKKVYQGAKALVDKASDLSEEGSKAGVVFGKAEKMISRFSKTGVESLGQTEHSILQAAGTFGVFGKAAGLTDRENAKFSKGLVKLATDMASFSNTTVEEALNSLSGGLRGEAEPLRKYGILLDDATLKARAMAMGILEPIKDENKIKAYHANVLVAQRASNEAIAEFGPKSIEAIKAQAKLGTAQSSLAKATEGTIPTLTAKQKILAAEAEIMKQTSLAQGDFKRTSEGLANQQRIAAAQSETLKTKLGQGLLPVFAAGAKILTKRVMPPLIELADKWVPKVSKAIAKWINNAPIDEYLDKAGDAFKRMRVHLSGMDTSSASGFFESVKKSLEGVDWATIGTQISSMADSGEKLGPVFKEAAASLPDLNELFTVTDEVLSFLARNVDKLAKALPYLAGGFVALKVAQALANAAALISVPLKVAEILVNRQLLKSNKALVVARKLDTGAIVTNTAATKVGILASIRHKVAMIASAVASKVVMVATKTWAAAQWLMNAALTANPIGLVVVAIAALVGGLILAYKKSETFQRIVDRAFKVVAATGRWLWNEALQPVFKLLVEGFAWLMDMFGKALDAISKVPGFGWAKGAADKMHGAADKAREMAEGIKDIPARKDVKITLTTAYKSMGGAGLTPAEARAAGLNPDGSKLFDSGGLAHGTGYMPKKIIKPERVLSPRQTAAFERLVATLEGQRGGKAGGGHNFNHYGDVVTPDPKEYLKWNQARSRATAGGGVSF